MNISSKFSDIFAKVFALFGVFFEKKIWNLKGDRPAWEHSDGSSGKNQKDQKKSDFECQPPVSSGVKNFFLASPCRVYYMKFAVTVRCYGSRFIVLVVCFTYSALRLRRRQGMAMVCECFAHHIEDEPRSDARADVNGTV